MSDPLDEDVLVERWNHEHGMQLSREERSARRHELGQGAPLIPYSPPQVRDDFDAAVERSHRSLGFTQQTPEAEARTSGRVVVDVHQSGDASASGPLAELSRVSAHRSNLQDRLEAVHAARWSR